MLCGNFLLPPLPPPKIKTKEEKKNTDDSLNNLFDLCIAIYTPLTPPYTYVNSIPYCYTHSKIRFQKREIETPLQRNSKETGMSDFPIVSMLFRYAKMSLTSHKCSSILYGLCHAHRCTSEEKRTALPAVKHAVCWQVRMLNCNLFLRF